MKQVQPKVQPFMAAQAKNWSELCHLKDEIFLKWKTNNRKWSFLRMSYWLWVFHDWVVLFSHKFSFYHLNRFTGQSIKFWPVGKIYEWNWVSSMFCWLFVASNPKYLGKSIVRESGQGVADDSTNFPLQDSIELHILLMFCTSWENIWLGAIFLQSSWLLKWAFDSLKCNVQLL